MLGKLIKHEFSATGRLMLPLMAAALALSVLAGAAVRVLARSEMSTFVEILSVFVLIGFFIALIAVNVVVFVQMIGRFYKNLLGNEGYLMFTLPTTPDTLLWSRLIVSSVWFVAVSILWAGAILVMMLIGAGELYLDLDLGDLSRGLMTFFEELGEGSAAAGKAHCAAYVVELLVISFLGCCVTCLRFYAPIAIGYSFSDHKGLLAVVFYFAMTTVESIVNFTLLDTDVLGRLSETLTPETINVAATVHYVFLGAILSQLIVGGIYYLLTSVFLRKRLNLP